MIEYYKDKSLADIEGEIWKDVSGYEKLYAISSFGRVKRYGSNEILTWSCGRKRKSEKKDRILAQKKHNRGYKMVCITKAGIKKYTTIHRLVAESFILNPENKRTVNHKNGIKWDNRVENLEWATDSENGAHSFRELGRKTAKIYLGKFGRKHNRSKPVLQIDLNGNIIKEWDNAQEVRRSLGYSSSNINRMCAGTSNYKKVHGFKWQYK